MVKTGQKMTIDEQLERLAKAHKIYQQKSKGNTVSKIRKIAKGTGSPKVQATIKGRVLPDLKTLKAMEEKIARLEAENAKLTQPKGFTLKVSEKGAVSLYGLRRFPVTFYKNEWLKMLDKAPELLQFIKANESRLAVKK